MTPFITRFAPSPTGPLHIGHAFAARQAFGAAARAGGTCLLRIEDIDQTRCKRAFETAILEDLTWLGFAWPERPRRQSDHMADYARALTTLRAKQLVYRCFRTRREIIEQSAFAPHDAGRGSLNGDVPFTGGPLPDDQEADALAQNTSYAWRLSIDRCRDYLGRAFDDLHFIEQGSGPERQSGLIKATPEIFGDAIIARKDTATSYHMACVHDDALQRVSDIVRGQDLFAVTHLHVLLQRVLDLPTPTYHHHRLLTDDHGKRFAKRDKAKTLQAMRAEGLGPDDIWTLIDAFFA